MEISPPLLIEFKSDLLIPLDHSCLVFIDKTKKVSIKYTVRDMS